MAVVIGLMEGVWNQFRDFEDKILISSTYENHPSSGDYVVYTRGQNHRRQQTLYNTHWFFVTEIAEWNQLIDNRVISFLKSQHMYFASVESTVLGTFLR